MNLTSPEVVKNLCKRYNLRPSKHRGQNFLIDRQVLDKIIENSNLKKDDVVLEIGPGLGCLTLELSKKVKKVIAVELDKRMVAIAKNNLQGINNIEILNENILDYQGKEKKYKLVANLPYVITSAVLKKFLTIENNPAFAKATSGKPQLIVVMIQKEVAERVTAKPGQMSLLALNCQLYATPKFLFQVSKNSFWPKPEVDSAVISLTPKETKGVNEKKFWQLAKIGFSSKRKMLANNLATGLHLEKKEIQEKLIKAKINPAARAQDLSIEDWLNLVKVF